MFAEAPMEVTMAAFAQESDADKKLFVQFRSHPKLMHQKSADAGRPIYEDHEYVTIMVPGDATSIVDRPAMQSDKDRFPVKYAAFKNRQDQQTAGGTPLRVCTFLTASQVRELEFFNCFTVEHLANMADNLGSKFPGFSSLKRMAQSFLEAAAGNAPMTRLSSELEKRDAELSSLREQMVELQATIARLSTADAED